MIMTIVLVEQAFKTHVRRAANLTKFEAILIWTVHLQGLAVHLRGYSHAVAKGVEILEVWSEDEVAELGEGEEHDEEHDSEGCQVLGTAAQGRRQLRHRLVEADVLEYLQWEIK